MPSLDFAPLELDGTRTPRVRVTSQRVSVTLVYGLAFLMIAGVFALVLAWSAFHLAERNGHDVSGVGWIIVLVIATAMPIVGLGGIILIIVLNSRGRSDLSSRLPAFAAANHLRYTAATPNPDYPGAIFHYGIAPTASDQLTTTEGRFVEVGNLTYGLNAGRTTVYRTWGYIAIRLDRRLPHMLMESTAFGPDSGGALPITIDRSQRLALEGDFDSYFTLYCPADYETDALYIFAPDLMALLVDKVGTYHVEIIDDWLFVYAPDSFRGADAATYRRVFDIVDALTAKALRQTRSYEDDHLVGESATIAAAGQRMSQAPTQYSRLMRVSLVGLGGIIVLFVIGYVVVAIVFR